MPDSVADPEFLRRVSQPKHGDVNLLFGQFFPENCMKLKLIGPKNWEASLAPPLDPPLRLHQKVSNLTFFFFEGDYDHIGVWVFVNLLDVSTARPLLTFKVQFQHIIAYAPAYARYPHHRFDNEWRNLQFAA